MATLRGDLLTIKVQQHASGTVNEIIAGSQDVTVSFSAEALPTTSQASGLNAEYQAGMVQCTISGSYLLATDGEQFNNLFAHMNAGENIEVEVHRSGTKFLDGEGVITSLELTGGLSDANATGSYSIQCSGNMAL